eukprot:5401893-Pyramimonas_sp.AAC.1
MLRAADGEGVFVHGAALLHRARLVEVLFAGGHRAADGGAVVAAPRALQLGAAPHLNRTPGQEGVRRGSGGGQ